MNEVYVNFEESTYAQSLINRGYAVQVYLDPNKELDKSELNHYARMLGYAPNQRGIWPDTMICYITQEIGNMPGHYIVHGNNNSTVYGLHGDSFYVLEEE